MSYPAPPPQSSTEKAARLVAAVIAALALVGVLLVAVITGDGAQSFAQGAGGSQDSGGGTVSGAGPSGATDFPSTTTSSTPTGTPGQASSSPSVPSAQQIRGSFPTPPGTTRIRAYAGARPTATEVWYLTTSSLATVHAYYVRAFRIGGWITFMQPRTGRDSAGRVASFFTIYHLKSVRTAELTLNANYRGKALGRTLIRVEVTDD